MGQQRRKVRFHNGCKGTHFPPSGKYGHPAPQATSTTKEWRSNPTWPAAPLPCSHAKTILWRQKNHNDALRRMPVIVPLCDSRKVTIKNCAKWKWSLKANVYLCWLDRKLRDEPAVSSFKVCKNRKGHFHICMNDSPTVSEIFIAIHRLYRIYFRKFVASNP